MGLYEAAGERDEEMKAKVNITLLPFRFPNFLSIDPSTNDRVAVGDLDIKTAEEYWDEMKRLWLIHVKERQIARK